MSGELMRRLKPYLGPALALGLLAAAAWALQAQLAEYNLQDITDMLLKEKDRDILLAFGLTAVNFIVLAGYDILALNYIGHPLAPYRAVLASFAGNAFSNTIGLSTLAGSSVRYRLYSSWGLTPGEIAKIVVFTTLTLWLGLFSIGGIIFTVKPLPLPTWITLPFHTTRPLGLILLAAPLAYLYAALRKETPWRIGKLTLLLPKFRSALLQVAVASLDWALAAAVLYALLPPWANVNFPLVLGAFLLGQIAGLISQVPGGLGVFESCLLFLLTPRIPAPALFAALVAYRVVYYFIPLALASALLAARETMAARDPIRNVIAFLMQWFPVVMPRILAFLTYLAGVVLLFSGATPSVSSRLDWLEDFLPLGVLEFSHFVGSLAGLGLIILARGLQKRLDAAYYVTCIVLFAGIMSSLLKGLDYEEAFLLTVLLLALLPCHKFFYRKASLLSEGFTRGWVAATVAALACTVALGYMAYGDDAMNRELWWVFTFEDEASRFMRAVVGMLVLLLCIAALRLMRSARPRYVPPSETDMQAVRSIVADSPQTPAYLALLGDKNILLTAKGDGFLMYGVAGRSWVCMGDPVGPPAARAELAWRFREMVDLYAGWTVFYQVDRVNLPLYLDLGLSLIKIGEEARVPLPEFSLAGQARKGLRYTRNMVEKEGAVFEIVPIEGVPAILQEMKAVSDAWLASKNAREKKFSLGFFSDEYMLQCPQAVVRKDGRMVAFANIWEGAHREELSVDLMRYLPDAPPSVMEYLYIMLMLWGREQGYLWFNLGMAPFSGLENHALAPTWARLGSLLYTHGGQLYNFQGLRRFKDKFDPVWESKYLASPGGTVPPRVLANIATLVSGGMRGVIAK
ncbi:MAG TPA: bifunctional lysylphosphatidylglycerol flippase/synthetase MprF [Humidesulfovibrio sp.]|uniref:bifunctional lysylphosphatidylglycerol flippase/synthetase MprF n=1 Tax=Humidesulfovibrio sp. TaxID=2910988 RepID=UPI002BEA94C8|nr:bifunctional lysylphosphatidylglycerol flippase/synthetase MprF [Humidesulfovibrio sp.]HWR02590.1 bifunctional lysylphosphatidylglycerol flippase/synthetase MprF [Humidesulfovibrio sp.]